MNLKKILLATISVLLFGLTSTANAQDRVEKDVVFAVMSGLSLTMDIYRPDRSNNRGIIFVPGSGWDGGPRGYTDYQLKNGYDYVNDLRDSLVTAGFTVFVPNHRAAPEYQYPDAVNDIQRAVRFVRHNASRYSIDPYPLGAAGHSSGGHLVAMTGVLDDDVALQGSKYPEERVSSRTQAVATIAAPLDGRAAADGRDFHKLPP
jgi:acetyl esterase/lipase